LWAYIGLNFVIAEQVAMRGRGGEGRVVGTKIKRTLLPKKPNNMH
jgi:hypothetical protein